MSNRKCIFIFVPSLCMEKKICSISLMILSLFCSAIKIKATDAGIGTE